MLKLVQFPSVQMCVVRLTLILLSPVASAFILIRMITSSPIAFRTERFHFEMHFILFTIFIKFTQKKIKICGVTYVNNIPFLTQKSNFMYDNYIPLCDHAVTK